MSHKKLTCFVAGLALVASIGFGAAKMAFAADTDSYDTTVITKQLETVPGQDLTETFTFTFAPYNDSNNVNPKLADATVTIDTKSADAVYKFDAANAQVTYFANTVDLMTDIKAKFANAKTGIYEYKVTETKGTKDKLSYDTNAYFLRVIKNGTSITTQVIKADPTNSEPGEQKVDPTPNKDRKVVTNKGGETSYKGSDFAFTNTYKLDTNAVMGKELTLTKKVSGLEAAGTQYTFKVSFVTPDKAKAAEIVAEGAEGAKGPFGKNNNGSFEITLSQGDSVKFSNIQEGTLYSVTETSTGTYTPSAAITTSATVTNLPDEVRAVGTAGQAYTVDYAKTNRTIVGANENSIVVTNTYEQVNPTGIIINNLPFILMVGIPVVAAVGYVVSRRKA